MAADYRLAAIPLDADPSWRPPRWTNNPQKTTGLFSFGRPKEEKLKSHHHPQLNSVNRRVNVVNRRPLHRQREPDGFRERLRDPATERKRTIHNSDL
ncbi:hypothetical protein Taro_039982 [Colocasia esculenta]|uniref:Uncharacterized protein n=1 Tax=Colocasia esculenta TaxID=4460 RepID=A0A843WRQ3_COLES|nr:hypothetical protein [Colocasia esculenta]